MESIDEKIAKLPAWARDRIKALELKADPNNEELRRLRKEATEQKRLRDRCEAQCEAMIEIMKSASVGGHELASQLIERVLDTWTMDRNGKYLD